jgi:superfamily I DNA/RNA helicase
MLIGEVVPIAYEYLRTNPLSDERSKYKHVLVDEFQDLNNLEQALVELLVGPETSVCVIGDDDQSIYAFRFAHPEGIQVFVADPATEAHEILTCLRCPPNVVELANSLIAADPSRARAPLVAVGSNDAIVATVQWASLDDEISGLSGAISGDIQSSKREPGDFLVLVNRRRIGYRLREALVAIGVPAYSFFQDNALKESRDAQASLALLRKLVEPSDRPSLRVWLAIGDAQGRAGAYGRLRVASEAVGLTEDDFLRDIVEGRRSLNVPALVSRYRDMVGRLDALGPMSVEELIDDLFPDTEQDLSLMRELAELVAQSATTARELMQGMLAAITQPEVPQSPDFVRIMSLHKSKGLTSPVVFIGSAVDGVIPTVRDGADASAVRAAVEEQRRLFYVAITRASSELVISGPSVMRAADAYAMRVRVRNTFVRAGVSWARTMPTPYLRELGTTQPDPVSGADWLAARSL